MKIRTGWATAWFLRILVLVAVAVVFFVPPLSEQGDDDTATIQHYGAVFDLAADGSMKITETIDVAMPSGKRGIFRIFDTRDERRNGVEHPVEDLTVTRDGQPEQHTWDDAPAGQQSLRIGNAAVYLEPGVHTYVITSATTNTLERGPDDTVRWWWNVVGSGWQMTMESVDVTVNLPAEVTDAECVQGDDTQCTADLSERTITVHAGPLDRYEPVTVRATFPEGAVPQPPADPGNNTLLLTIVAALIGAGAGLAFVFATRERTPGFPVLFEPPEGISPALGAKVLTEVDSADDLQATLYDLGAKGIVRLDGNDYAWTVNLLADPVAAQAGEAERAMLTSLGLTSIGDSFLVSKDASSGEKLTTARSTLRGVVSRQAGEYLAHSGVGWLGNLLGWLATLGVLALAGLWLFGNGGWFSWPLFALLAAFSLVDVGVATNPGSRTKRTPAGRELWSRSGGFSRFLTTDSSESRFEAAKHMDWYPTYLAWALVFGSADAWARRFTDQGVEPPAPAWIYWTGAHNWGASGFASAMSSSFDAAISSANASYAASQASSGSSSFGGGGGFSGGSGGGGGGGGSW